MKLKKGFTLSEILIALTLIGIITTLTIPSLIASTDKGHKEVAFKKAFNTISGAYSQAMAESPDISNVYDLVDKMKPHLNVKYYLNGTTKTAAAHGTGTAAADSESYWIVTEDGMGYKIKQIMANGPCAKDKVALVTSAGPTTTNYCYLITIDIDGPQKGAGQASTVTVENNKIAGITGDLFYVFATRQGLTVGSSTWRGANNSAAVIMDND